MNDIKTLSLSRGRTDFIVWVMLSIMPIIGMCTDLVAPSLPAIAAGLHVSATLAKNAMTTYLIGFCLGNFLSGFLTDAWGRSKLLRAALFGFALVSLLPILFPNITALLISRILQGYLIGTASVVLRGVCADVLSPEELVKLGPWFGIMWGIGPIVGPILGGYFQEYFGWQAGFYFFTIISFILLLVVVMGVPETYLNKHLFNLQHIKKNITEVFRNHLFLGISAMMGVTYALIILFNVSGPFLIQTELHHSPIFFGKVALLIGIFFLLTTISIRLLLRKFSVEKLWFVNVHILFGSTILLLILSYLYPMSVTLTVIASGVMFWGCGAMLPMSIGKGLSLFRHIAGTAAAVMYLINIGICSLTSYIAGFIHVANVSILMWLYAVLVIFAMGIYWGILRRA